MVMRDWVRLPSGWIKEGGLRGLRWTGVETETHGADNVAALMVLLPLAHHADEEGLAKCTYDQFCVATGLSRAKVAKGLDVLERLSVIGREPEGRSTFQLLRYTVVGGWSKLPARRLYSQGSIHVFDGFRLRLKAELDALKLYYLFVRFRSTETNMAHLSYDKIEHYTGVRRPAIKQAISLLASLGLVHVEHLPSRRNERGIQQAYRIALLDPYTHLGTRGRDPDFGLPDDNATRTPSAPYPQVTARVASAASRRTNTVPRANALRAPVSIRRPGPPSRTSQ
jgi:hypothetical protein